MEAAHVKGAGARDGFHRARVNSKLSNSLGQGHCFHALLHVAQGRKEVRSICTDFQGRGVSNFPESRDLILCARMFKSGFESGQGDQS